MSVLRSAGSPITLVPSSASEGSIVENDLHSQQLISIAVGSIRRSPSMALRHAEERYVADACVEELAPAELLLIATLRLFAARCRDPAGSHPDWRNGFRAAAIAECAVPAFNALFNIISVAALRPLDVRCPHCRFLGEDEAHFLRLQGLLQGLQTDAAAAILAGWLTDSAARMAMLP